MERKGDVTIVTSRVIGSLPGSPVDLRYAFRLEPGGIAALEIVGGVSVFGPGRRVVALAGPLP